MVTQSSSDCLHQPLWSHSSIWGQCSALGSPAALQAPGIDLSGGKGPYFPGSSTSCLLSDQQPLARTCHTRSWGQAGLWVRTGVGRTRESPGRTCQDQGKTHFEMQPPVPKWGQTAAGRAPVKGKAHSRRSKEERLGTEKGCSCDTDAAAEVEQESGGRSGRASTRGSAGTSASAAGAGSRSSSRCSRPWLAREGPGGEVTRT